MKNKLLCVAIFTFMSCFAIADESPKTLSINGLTSVKWGTPQDQFMSANQGKYEKPYQDNGADFYVSKDHVLIDDVPFKQIVKIQEKRGLTSINYINIADKETFESSCKKIYDLIEKNFSSPTYQEVNNGPMTGFYVWIDQKGTTLYQFCFSESAMQTIILTVEPKWKVLNCHVENSKNEYVYFYDEMNNIVREYSLNHISNVLKTNVTANKIEFSSEKNSSYTVIDLKNMSFSIKMSDSKTEKGQCVLK